MAREVVTKCDKCGRAGNDVRTITLRDDGVTVEVDLDTEHKGAVTIAEAFKIGRVLESGIRRTTDNRSLERRIRNAPEA